MTGTRLTRTRTRTAAVGTTKGARAKAGDGTGAEATEKGTDRATDEATDGGTVGVTSGGGTEDRPLIEVADLDIRFGTGPGQVHAVRGASLALAAGRCLALVGESGSGKSALARSLLGLAGPTASVSAAHLRLFGQDARRFGDRDWRTVRGRRIGLVAQDALVALDPLRPVGKEIAEPLLTHRIVPRSQAGERVVELLERVGVPEPAERAASHVHQLSGGLRQRALIASALAAEPGVLIADEPTTALDASVQARILALLGELKAGGTGLLLISHDLAVVEALADRVAVMKDGRIVESGPVADVLERPRHAYTRALLAAVPGSGRRERAEPTGPAGRASTARVLAGEPLLVARDLAKEFKGPGGRRRTAVSGVSFTLRPGESLGLVGESGSGKSTLARMVLGLVAPDAGEIHLAGRAWSTARERDRRPLRGTLQLVPQDPLSAFDPRWSVERIVGEALAAAGVPRQERRARTLGLLTQVGLDGDHLARRPSALSGGQRQRVAIARALAPGPRLLVCDEPVSALDVSVQAQVLDLLRELQESLGLATLFISHDLAVVREVCARVMVMKDGRIVESGPVDEVFAAPSHPYTRTLLEAVPKRARAAVRTEGTADPGVGHAPTAQERL
ncbi:ABC transporter ATP-binding protein [Streptomyces sp. ISL-36]|uniref:dipeptide ABC transporter ATP-binding protein n=1 Tax=Streptomyces sp. ISL-36 TaxID=2819182 RepID=UPI001BE6AC76|nr:ABC transporter ATP-binding protein [Streptomyces sp. ISL-36]MBT2442551.1 ABC transporter ATP-binding protein [Streptomyces sp. ISL-36]